MLKLTEEHLLFKESVKNFVDKEIRENVLEWEDVGRTPKKVWRRCGEMGFLGINYPEKFGGMGLDFSYTSIFHQEMAKCGSLGVALGLSVQTDMATPAIAKYGSDFLRENYLVPAIKGNKICAIAVSEPDAGSDVSAIRTRARKNGDSWVIDGQKTFITNGSQADFITLLARTNEDTGYKGLSLFVVPTDLEGFSCGKILKKTCYQSSDTAEISFNSLKLSKDHLIGEEGRGFLYQMEQFQLERLAVCFLSLGCLKRCYSVTKRYVKERNAFGRPLIGLQTIRHKLAQMLSEISLLENSINTVVAKINQGFDITKDVSMLKLVAAQIQQRQLEECVQIHGGWGLMQEYEVARYFRDSKLLGIGGGTSEIMKEIICKMEGLE